MESVLITPIFAVILSLFYLFLTMNVVNMRGKYKVGIHANNNRPLDLAIRCHANFSETVPIALILMFFVENMNAHKSFVLLLGLLLLIGRVLHYSGLSKFEGKTFGRFYGMLLTILSIFFSSIGIVFFTLKPLF